MNGKMQGVTLVADWATHDLAAGPVPVGTTIPEAFNALHRLELSCRTQIAAMSCNSRCSTAVAISSPACTVRLPSIPRVRWTMR